MNAPAPRFRTDDLPGAEEARRPLYIGRGVAARVDLDGPALRLRARRRAERRYPLYRISRVVAGPSVEWGADAVRACLAQAIPIVIVGDDGAPLGWIYPARSKTSRLHSAIEELLDRPDWREWYGNWLRAMRMRTVVDWHERRQTEGTQPDPLELRELIRRHVYASQTSVEVEIGGVCRGALCALAAQVLSRFGLKPVYFGHGGEPLELLGDLAGLLALRLSLEVRPAMHGVFEREASALRVLHALSDKLNGLATEAIASLARRLRETLDEWR
ncbi:MAG: CRISPR-associated endonuclease Cas1 [Burkholderiales bacterium]|nr:CRISPR-associated endonuclease Cas1 [Burkholderiales bacterium]